MMTLPDYWLPRPALDWSDEVESELEAIYQRQVAPGSGGWVDAELPVPKWAFLCWLSDKKSLLLHGSGDANIAVFQPRTPVDNSPDDFSKQTAVFAASDGISSMFYAIINRGQIHVHMMTAALYFELTPGELMPMHYFFSVNDEALAQQPWREGTIYILPNEGFAQQESYVLAGRVVHEPHWASLNPVKPLARLPVTTADFPFFVQVRGHDEAHIRARVAADPYGYPWLDD